MVNTRKQEANQSDLRELMPHRVGDILLVATPYDSFILEEDGTFSDRIYREYMELQLTSPPRLTRASSAEEALERLQERHFDIVITMARIADMTPEGLAKAVKKVRPDLPVVMLTYGSLPKPRGLRHKSYIDYVFVWKGDSSLLLALVKTIEDKFNVEYDTSTGKVRVIVVVEDSPSDYSSYLTLLYTVVMKQTQSLVADSLNYADRLQRIRARPKILLARTYEEAESLVEKYSDYLLGVVSDMSYPRGGKSDPQAGLRLLSKLQKQRPNLPMLLQSADAEMVEQVQQQGIAFVDKNSPAQLRELSDFISLNFGFGHFVFLGRDGLEMDRARNLTEMIQAIQRVPGYSLGYHADRNHFSNWLMARGEFSLAFEFQARDATEFETIEHFRAYLRDAFETFVDEKQRGRITEFSRTADHLGRDFVRLGGGSLGGKGRGIAFMYRLLAHSSLSEQFPDLKVLVPRTTVICTDEFDRFLDENDIRKNLSMDSTDDEVTKVFLKGKLSKDIRKDLEALLEEVRYPLAVRSSSLLEDSQFQPFAGLYATYMLPNNDDSIRVRARQLRQAIKLVYASTYLSGPRAYMHAIGRRVEEEKMGVLIQRLIGREIAGRFYPSFAGTAQSYNYYPLRYMKPDDGIAVVALGLGRTVAEGGRALRFSPKHPRVLPQMGTPDEALRNSQRQFFALDMMHPRIQLVADEEGTLVQPDLSVAEEDGNLAAVGATYCPQDERIYDDIHRKGIRIVNFSPVLKYDLFPLPQLLSETLRLGRAGMGCAVEVEFAVNIASGAEKRSEFAVLQLRPLVTSEVDIEAEIDHVDPGRIILRSERTLGNGLFAGIRDIVYVPPELFDPTDTVKMAEEVALINATLVASARPYVLIGPGRWGTRDRFLGIPVSWMQVSAARIIVELGVEGFDVDPSQGTHFFHNITSLRTGYVTVDGRRAGEAVDWEWIGAQSLVSSMQYVRHVSLAAPIEARLDGRTGAGVIIR
jgi:CheY-like chemotaxis protein